MHDPFPSPPTGLSRHAIAPLADFLNLSTLPLHIHELLIAFLTYNFIFSVVAPAVSDRLVPSTYRNLSKKTRTDWNVRVTSLIQSTFITVAALSLMVLDKPHRDAMTWRERLWGYDGMSGMVQAFAAGYFLWDVQVSSVHLSVLGVGSLVHAVSALIVTCLGFRPFANYYGIHFVLYEMSTPFLNMHWFADKLGMTGSTFQLVNGIVLIATFGCSRLLWGTYQSMLIYKDLWTAWNFVQPKAAAGLETVVLNVTDFGGASAVEAVELDLWLGVLYLGSNTILCALNFYWFGLMISSVRKRFVPLKGKRRDRVEGSKKSL